MEERTITYKVHLKELIEHRSYENEHGEKNSQNLNVMCILCELYCYLNC